VCSASEQSGQVGHAVDDRVRLGLGARLGAVALAAADQHRRRADRVATTDVGGQVVVGRSVAGIGDQTWVARSPGPARQLASSSRTPSAPRPAPAPPVRRRTAGRRSRSGDQLVLGGREAEPGQAVGEPGWGIESLLVVKRTVRPWARSHRTASGVPGTTWLPTYSVPSRSRSTVSMPVSRPTTHLRHVRLEPPEARLAGVPPPRPPRPAPERPVSVRRYRRAPQPPGGCP
jgi:hypothetical protein